MLIFSFVIHPCFLSDEKLSAKFCRNICSIYCSKQGSMICVVWNIFLCFYKRSVHICILVRDLWGGGGIICFGSTKKAWSQLRLFQLLRHSMV
uniref:Uncharacterized protein n=1 Tax=Arundo donax TaxID=35708 RepID=A0A0A9FSE8_ARUDO